MQSQKSNHTKVHFSLIIHVETLKKLIQEEEKPSLVSALNKELVQLELLLKDFESTNDGAELYRSMLELDQEYFDMLPDEVVGWCVSAYADESGAYPADLLTDSLHTWEDVCVFA